MIEAGMVVHQVGRRSDEMRRRKALLKAARSMVDKTSNRSMANESR